MKPKKTYFREEKRNEFLDKNLFRHNVHDKSGREQDRYQRGVSMKMKENKHCRKYKTEREGNGERGSKLSLQWCT